MNSVNSFCSAKLTVMLIIDCTQDLIHLEPAYDHIISNKVTFHTAYELEQKNLKGSCWRRHKMRKLLLPGAVSCYDESFIGMTNYRPLINFNFVSVSIKYATHVSLKTCHTTMSAKGRRRNGYYDINDMSQHSPYALVECSSRLGCVFVYRYDT